MKTLLQNTGKVLLVAGALSFGHASLGQATDSPTGTQSQSGVASDVKSLLRSSNPVPYRSQRTYTTCGYLQESNNFENGWTSNTLWPAVCADDFVVPAGECWSINRVSMNFFTNNHTDASAMNIYFYADAGGVPGTVVGSYVATPSDWSTTLLGNNFGINIHEFLISIPPSVNLCGGASGTTYWFSAQAVNTITSNDFYWEVAETGSPYGDNGVAASDIAGPWSILVNGNNRSNFVFALNPSAMGTDTQTACDSYTWIDGNTYTSSNNTATHTFVGGAADGCDSVVTLDLTILGPATGTDTQTACGSYTWIDGNTYTSNNNTATHTLVGAAANGCDSVVTLDLTILLNCHTTQLDPCYDNDTLPALNTYLKADFAPGATQYEFCIVNQATDDTTYLLGIDALPNYTSLVFLERSDYATCYSIRVRAMVSGVWGNFGTPVTLYTPVPPIPRISAHYCGDTVPSLKTSLTVAAASRAPQARTYRYCFIDTLAGDTIVVEQSGHRSWVTTFHLVPGVKLNTTYCIYVQVEVCIGGQWVWGEAGELCYITTPDTYRRYQSGGSVATEEQPGTLQSANGQASMAVYPNPGKGFGTLLSIENLGKQYNTVDVVVLDAYGKQVYNRNINVSGNGFEIPIQFGQRLTPGVYFVNVHAGETQMIEKLIIR